METAAEGSPAGLPIPTAEQVRHPAKVLGRVERGLFIKKWQLLCSGLWEFHKEEKPSSITLKILQFEEERDAHVHINKDKISKRPT